MYIFKAKLFTTTRETLSTQMSFGDFPFSIGIKNFSCKCSKQCCVSTRSQTRAGKDESRDVSSVASEI